MDDQATPTPPNSMGSDSPSGPPPIRPNAPPIARPSSVTPPRPTSNGRSGWWWFGVFLLGAGGLVLVGLLVLGGLGSLLGGAFAAGHGGKSHGPHFEEVVKQEGNSHERILVIRVEGVITGDAIESVGYSIVDLLKDQLDRAGEDPNIKAVILKVDSPGGEVLASDDMYHALVDFQQEHHKPVVASMGNLAASGGYYISAPCRWIVANELTITGSIGVIMHGMNYRGLMDKVGVRPEVFKSGRFKDMMSGDKREEDISKEERDMVQKMVNDTFGRFKAVVAEGRTQANTNNAKAKSEDERGRTLSSRWQDFADGRILSGKEAYDLGFVDELGSFQAAVDRAQKIAGLDDPELVELHPSFDLSHFLRIFGDTRMKPIKVDLGMDRSRLKSGFLYFLWPMGLN